MDEINKISADIEKPELSKDAKEKAAKSRDERLPKLAIWIAKSPSSVAPASANFKSNSCACAKTSLMTS